MFLIKGFYKTIAIYNKLLFLIFSYFDLYWNIFFCWKIYICCLQNIYYTDFLCIILGWVHYIPRNISWPTWHVKSMPRNYQRTRRELHEENRQGGGAATSVGRTLQVCFSIDLYLKIFIIDFKFTNKHTCDFYV